MRPLFLLLPALATVAFAQDAPETPKVPAPVKAFAFLGQATSNVVVYSAPSGKAKALLRIEKGAYMAVRPAGKNWFAIFMADRRLSYVPGQAVTLMFDGTGRPITYTQAQVASFRSANARPNAGYVASRGGAPRGSEGARGQVADYATQWEGTTPYKWGGTELGSGIDCSGFVKKMYGAIGVALPRTAAEQARVGLRITRYEDLQKGDRLYFWDAKRGKIGHTGIYLGNGYFVHSSSGRKGIAQDYLSARWQRICVDARR